MVTEPWVCPKSQAAVDALLRTPEEAAILLRCKSSWLKEKARRREIPFTLIGGAYRFTDAHLDRIIRQFEEQPQQHLPAPAAPRRRKHTEPEPHAVADLQPRLPRRLRSTYGE
ncbi:MAG: helix-turn-helix domain-containing protein [Actinoallomurus sp.]